MKRVLFSSVLAVVMLASGFAQNRVVALTTHRAADHAGICAAGTCDECDGRGKRTCGWCGGDGIRNGHQCTFCNGRGTIKCAKCGGSGKTR
jgi:hypothetical protein